MDSPKVPLGNKPGKTNWIEKYKVLEPHATNWIYRVAEHLKGKGMPDGEAIATAKNAAEKLCATGDLNFPGVQQANAGSRAEACAAIAKWKAAAAAAGRSLDANLHEERSDRAFRLDQAEVREETDGLRFEGHAAVFDQPSSDLGGFTEYVARGAFGKVLANGPDVRMLFNHDRNQVLARTRSQTMQLSEDSQGLAVDARWPNTTLGNDLRELMRRGDIDQMSFGFRVGRGNDTVEERDGIVVRTISNFEQLFDVSLVTFPAYPQTDAALRMMLDARELGVDLLNPPEDTACPVTPDDILARNVARARDLHLKQLALRAS